MVAQLSDRYDLRVSRQWALALVRWVEHLKRHQEMPAAMLVNVQTELWLETMRALRWTVSSHPSIQALGTGTRSGPGKPLRWSERWLDKLQQKLGTENPERNKALTKQRAMFVEHGLLHGVRILDE